MVHIDLHAAISERRGEVTQRMAGLGIARRPTAYIPLYEANPERPGAEGHGGARPGSARRGSQRLITIN